MKIKVNRSLEEEEVDVAPEPTIKVTIGTHELQEESPLLASPTIKIKIGDGSLEEEIDIFNEPAIRVLVKKYLEDNYPTIEEDEGEEGPEQPNKKIKIKVDNNNVLDPHTKNVTDEKKPTQKTIKLIARRTLNGDVLVFDHKDVDIALMFSRNKIVAFPKEEYGDKIYETQLRFFEYLVRKGIVEYDSIQGGNTLMSMEASIVESPDYNIPQIALVTVGNWIEQERPYFEWQEKWEEEQERQLLEPEEGEYTEFDPDRYHSPDKGSIRPKMTPYGTPGIYRF
jgi:hypothetical protein